MLQKYRKLFREWCEVLDATFNSMVLDDLTDIEAVFNSPLSKFITFAANNCGYSGSACYFIVN